MKLIILFLLLLSTQFLKAQTWERIFGENSRIDFLEHLNEAYDNGYWVLGSENYFPDIRGYLFKTDINGNQLYRLSLGVGTGINQLNKPTFVSQTNEGGSIICGGYGLDYLGDIGITKLDACGNLEWCKIFRTINQPDWGRKILQLPDGGYIMLTQGYASTTNNTKIHLFRFNSSGEVLWIEPYVLTENHPYIDFNGAYDFLITNKGDYFISGFCYWCDDSVINGGWNNPCRIKAMTLMVDSNKTEMWVSAFRDTIITQSSGARFSTERNNLYYIGANSRVDITYPIMMIVADSLGNYIHDTLPQIPNIGEKWAEGYLLDPLFTSNGKMFAHTLMVDSTNFYPGWFSLHELDTLGGWHNSFIHPTAHAESRIIVTDDDKILAGAVVGSGLDQDIILMKFNPNLEYDSIYTAPRVYDYLCPDPIVSKTIDLSDCDVIVNVEDIPTRKEYEARISLIPITPAPNPAKEYVRFLLKNTEYHKNIRVVCYDIFGRQMVELPVNSGVNETGLSISGWRPGLYMAVVYSGNRQMGKARYVVE